MATTKKTQKIETPIDRHETFVSISRNFADSDTTVSEKLQALYELQQTDCAIDKILQLRGELPMEVERLEAEIAELKAKSDHLNMLVVEFTKGIAENKHNIAECEIQIDKYRSQLQNISNSREYDSINKEIENQDLLRQIAEKNIGEAKEKIEEKKQEIALIKEKLAVRNGDLDAKQEELSVIIESTAKDEEVLNAKREACAAKIDARTMSAYDHIRKSVNNHLAVVGVYNSNSCGGCFSTISPQQLINISSNKKLIICEYCGRILVNPDNFEK